MALSEKYLPTIRSTFTGGVMPVSHLPPTSMQCAVFQRIAPHAPRCLLLKLVADPPPLASDLQVGVCMNNSRPYVEQDGYVYPTYEQYTSGTHSISLASPTAVTSAVIQLAVSTSTSSSSASIASGSSVSAAANHAAGSSSSNAAKATSSSKKASSASSAQGGGGARGSAVVAWTAMLGAAGVAALGLVMA